MKKLNQNISGFSLIELSIVIAIAAVMIGSGIMMINEYSNRSKIEQTHEKMEAIMKMLKRYYIRYQRLPCPADPTIAFSDPHIGFETACNSPPYVGPNPNSGALPTDALGLPPAYMIDAWGNRFKYVVDWAVSLSCLGGAATTLAPNNLIRLTTIGFTGANGVYDDNSMGAAEQVISVVLISHGENGYGAYSGRNGTLNPSSGNIFEVNNAATNNTFYASVPVNGYDDITYMYNYGQLRDPLPTVVSPCISGFPDALKTVTDEGFMYGK